jgi:hypothetical protein
MLTTHVRLVPRLRMSGALPLLFLCAFMVWTGTTLLLVTFGVSMYMAYCFVKLKGFVLGGLGLFLGWSRDFPIPTLGPCQSPIDVARTLY